MKELSFTSGGLGLDSFSRIQEVSRGHSRKANLVKYTFCVEGKKKENRTREANSEGLNFLTKGADLKMRKKQRQQNKGEQLSLFPKQIVSLRPNPKADRGTIERGFRESNYFSLLTRNRAFTETLLEQVMSPTNLNKAYESVRRNGGTSGVDSMDIDCLLYTSPSPRDRTRSRMPSSA